MTPISPDQVRAIAQEAYVFGVPMVDTYTVIHSFSIDTANPQYKGPFNSILNVARVFTPDDTAFVTPNSDTPYSFAGLDLRAEPVVITVPPIDAKRYFVFQLMDLYSFNFAYIGTRATGNGGGSYLIAGPGWKGEKPKGITAVIPSETQFVSVVGRTQLFDAADLDNVKAIQAGYRVQPLSAFLGSAAPPAAPALTWSKPLVGEQARTSVRFFELLSFLLQFAMPPHPSEVALRQRFAEIGIEPGKALDTSALPQATQDALKAGMEDGQKAIDAKRATLGGKSDALFGTREFLKNDYVARATGTQVGIGANSREEAIYPILDVDADGQPLDGGKNRYRLTFAQGELPPVNAFWSVTMYALPSQLLVKNPMGRYLINSPMLPGLKTDADGGLTIDVQSSRPARSASRTGCRRRPAASWWPCVLLPQGCHPRRQLEDSGNPPRPLTLPTTTMTTPDEIRAIAKEAYLYGFAMMENYGTWYQQAAVHVHPPTSAASTSFATTRHPSPRTTRTSSRRTTTRRTPGHG